MICHNIFTSLIYYINTGLSYCTNFNCYVLFSGEADGETGLVSKAVETAVLCRKVFIRGAEDFYKWCSSNLTKEGPKSKRHFVYVKSEDIQRDRPGITDLNIFKNWL